MPARRNRAPCSRAWDASVMTLSTTASEAIRKAFPEPFSTSHVSWLLCASCHTVVATVLLPICHPDQHGPEGHR